MPGRREPRARHRSAKPKEEPATAPPPLYKYRSLSEESRAWTEDIIRNSRLWYSKASAFNDPFDCNLSITGKAEGEWEQMFGDAIGRFGDWFRSGVTGLMKKAGVDVPKALQPKEREKTEVRRWDMTIKDSEGNLVDTAEFFNSLQRRRLARMYEILDESFGVLSLSAKPDDILMWSHYANRHDGVCLEFRTTAHPNAFPRLHPVRYELRYPSLSAHFPDFLEMMQRKRKHVKQTLLLDVAHLLAGELRDEAETDPVSSATLDVARWFYVKSAAWEYEREWRALSDGPGLVRFTKRALKGIIVGCVNTEANLEWAREMVAGRKPRVALYKAVKKEHEFGLDVVPVR